MGWKRTSGRKGETKCHLAWLLHKSLSEYYKVRTENPILTVQNRKGSLKTRLAVMRCGNQDPAEGSVIPQNWWMNTSYRDKENQDNECFFYFSSPEIFQMWLIGSEINHKPLCLPEIFGLLLMITYMLTIKSYFKTTCIFQWR